MKIGRIPESILKRSVLKQIKSNNEEVIKGAAVGSDCAFIRIQDQVAAMAGGSSFLEEKDGIAHAMVRALNCLAADKCRPLAVHIFLMLPESYFESDLKECISQAQAAAEQMNLTIAGTQTQIVREITHPLVNVTAIGEPIREPLVNVTAIGEPIREPFVNVTAIKEPMGESIDMAAAAEKKILPGFDIVMTKWIALSATALLAKQKEKELKEKYPAYFIKEAQKLSKYYSVWPEAATAVQSSVCMMRNVSEGGIFGALWELGESAGVGLTTVLKKIPVKQETVEICNFFDINPYESDSDGAMLMVTQDGAQLCRKLEQQGIVATVIGQITQGNDRVVINDEEKRYLEPKKTDELYRIQ